MSSNDVFFIVVIYRGEESNQPSDRDCKPQRMSEKTAAATERAANDTSHQDCSDQILTVSLSCQLNETIIRPMDRL